MSRAVFVNGHVMEADELEEYDAEAARMIEIAETAEAAVDAVRNGYGAEFSDEDHDTFLAMVREGLS